MFINEMAMLSIVLAFAASVLALKLLSRFLPHDQGRAFAVNGQLSKGKPRGAGLLFVLVFIAAALCFVSITTEWIIYYVLTAAAMLSGFLDDSAKKPWGEWLKGLIDLAIAVAASVTYLNFNPSSVGVTLGGSFLPMHPFIFGALMVLLIWVSINVTNCADGVDGLCGSLSVVSLLTIHLLASIKGDNPALTHIILLMTACLLGYLWFNISPSKLLMGDAGSRAIGFFIAVAVVKAGIPLLYPFVAAMLLIDGGLGLVKLFLLRSFKLHLFRNIRMPLHDFARKTKGWSDSQVVFRFLALQTVVSFLCVALVMQTQ